MRLRSVLAENLKSLMAATPALSKLPQITKAGGGSNGLLDTIRRAANGTSIDNLEPLARVYGVQAWQLLVPGLDPAHPPAFGVEGFSPLAQDVARMLDAMPDEDQKRRAYALFVQLVEFGSSDPAPPAQSAPLPAPMRKPARSR